MTKTRAGWLANQEVVEVTFDPSVISYEELLSKGLRAGVVSFVFTRTDAQQAHAKRRVTGSAKYSSTPIRLDKQPKYHLAQTRWRHMPLREEQSARINGLIYKQKPAAELEALLDAPQRELWKLINQEKSRPWPVAVDVPFDDAWAAAQDARAK